MSKDIHSIYCFGGNGNFGDDYILREWIDYILDVRPGQTVLAAVSKSWMQGAYLGQRVYFNDFIVQASHAEMVATKKRKGGEALTLEERIECGTSAALKLLSPKSPWRHALQRIRTFHLAGGGYINDIFPLVYGYLATFSTLAEHLGVPLVGTGLGLLPSSPSSNAVVDMLRSFRYLECRDDESQKLVGGSSVAGLDDTFLMPVRRCSAEGDAKLFINIQGDQDTIKLHDALLSEILNLYRNDQMLGRKLHYLSFYEHSDSIFLRHLRECGVVLETTAKSDLFAKGLPFRPEDIVISTRFHCHLLAARCGSRGVYAIGRRGYYDIKHASLVRLGTNWREFPSSGLRDTIERLRSPQIEEQHAISRKQELAGELLA